MKTKLMHFISIIKTLKVSLFTALLCILAFSQCQPEEVAPHISHSRGGSLDDKAPNPIPTSIPPNEVVRADYPGATSWLITFNHPNLDIEWSYQRFFSTVDGSFHTLDELNSSAEATSRADFEFLKLNLKSIERFEGGLTYQEYMSATKLKPADFGLLELANMKVNQPELFQTAYEESPWEGTEVQPINSDQEANTFSAGEIYLFKTGRDPVRYGAVRIVERQSFINGTGDCKVEVIVQADNGYSR